MSNPTSEAEMTAGKELAEAYAKLTETGNAAKKYGLDITAEAIARINKRLPTPMERMEFAEWLASPKNYETITHPLMGKTPTQQIAKIDEYINREDWRGSIKDGDTEDYIDARRQAKREGKRR
jgi:hypothetical protein